FVLAVAVWEYHSGPRPRDFRKCEHRRGDPPRCAKPVVSLIDLRTHPATEQPQRQRLQRPRTRSSSRKDPLGAPFLLTWIKHSKNRPRSETRFRGCQQNLTTKSKESFLSGR